jgi:hypothetical protein
MATHIMLRKGSYLVMQRAICHDGLSDLEHKGIDDIILCRRIIRFQRFASIC